MFSLRNKKKIYLNYPQYPLLSGDLISSATGMLQNRIMTSNIQEYLSLIVRLIVCHCKIAVKLHTFDAFVVAEIPYQCILQ